MRSLTELPGLRGLPLVGNLLQLDLKQLHRVLERWCNDFGPRCRCILRELGLNALK